ncbi:FAD-dependent monooxygenase [Telmatocola sphagniphila]|uniref:FAD-dependent monooxygenase n=1 Tax=Telmatocola sphagniphila TaxID=1123043 RepID=A0A8E6B8B5_9BACT|nr:NAD(P)/FAD-dependent oxidoreductase [Telmatocola sphagniphila]QVL33732.1 FAD-dependent monooxygenase [Telmatocola sphagniphila]
MARTYRIAIVGLGTAGTASAILLARQGHEVHVFEQAPEVGARGAGILLQTSGQRILAHLGLREQVTRHSAILTELDARHSTGQPLICNRYSDYRPGNHALGTHRGVLFTALYRELQKTSAVIHLDSPIVRREVQGRRVWIVDAQEVKQGPFDFLLVADGARSRLRAACGFRARVHRYAHGTLWWICPGSGRPGKLFQVVRGNRHLFGLLPLGDNRVTVYWGMPHRELAQLPQVDLENLKAEILQFAPESQDALTHLIDREQLIPTTYQHVWMPRIKDATTLFIGDAAHAMSPHLGQGANLALVDAWKFANCLQEAATPPAAFEAFRIQQRAYLRYYAILTYLLSPFFQSDWFPLAWGRDIALPWLPKIPIVKRQMLMTVSGLKGGFFQGEIDLPAPEAETSIHSI